jgi:hypothetical protein
VLLSDGERGWPTYRITVMQTPLFIRFSGYLTASDYLAGAPPDSLPATGSRRAVPTLSIAALLTALGVVAVAVAARPRRTS